MISLQVIEVSCSAKYPSQLGLESAPPLHEFKALVCRSPSAAGIRELHYTDATTSTQKERNDTREEDVMQSKGKGHPRTAHEGPRGGVDV